MLPLRRSRRWRAKISTLIVPLSTLPAAVCEAFHMRVQALRRTVLSLLSSYSRTDMYMSVRTSRHVSFSFYTVCGPVPTPRRTLANIPICIVLVVLRSNKDLSAAACHRACDTVDRTDDTNSSLACDSLCRPLHVTVLSLTSISVSCEALPAMLSLRSSRQVPRRIPSRFPFCTVSRHALLSFLHCLPHSAKISTCACDPLAQVIRSGRNYRCGRYTRAAKLGSGRTLC